MIFEILRIGVILLIAAPFLYMFYDVTVDFLKRSHEFYQKQAKPVLVGIMTSVFK